MSTATAPRPTAPAADEAPPPKRPRRKKTSERIESEGGPKLSDRNLERLIDELIATNEERLAAAH